ncbi:hypothetical protein [Massilia sp. DWR3-1-1]|uniref:hypothetical protein n=1 Tax=Massilia sp. DWR3-1-1 TaxID=2804559 RepID=UPI003CF3147A
MPVYVQHEALGKVPDVFNAEALWQAPGLALFARRPLLRDLLERSPREQRGRAATRCFSHVTLLLPQDDVDDDRHLTRGARVRDLAASLAALHQKDFGDLLGEDQVRYDVVGADTLEAGQVEVRFGHAVYLPAADEPVLYRIATSTDSAIWHSGAPIHRDQRLALVAGAGAATVLLINDAPETALEVQVRPKNAFECQYDALGGYYVIRSRPGLAPGEPVRLLLKVTRVGSPAMAPVTAPAQALAKSAAVWKTRARVDTAPPQAAAERTALPASVALPGSVNPAIAPADAPGADSGIDATYAPLARQRVSLAALALPRLSRYRDTGAVSLEIGFDEQLAPAAAGVEPVISFAVDAADELVALTRAGRERVNAPASFTPVDGASIRLASVAAPMAERYRALLVLPARPASAGVAVPPGARFVFGRGAPMLAGLRVLDGARFVHHAAGAADADASADRIGLSRTAFSFEATASGYQIGRLSPTQALYHLDEQLEFVAALAGDGPYLLPPGHHLVAGHYVLRFDA